jgi:Kef-type K+ transport system membrane component KefB
MCSVKKGYFLILIASMAFVIAGRQTATTYHHEGMLLASPAGSGHADPVTPVLLALVVILGSAKLGGHLFQKIGQPPVLGELVVGIILGNLMLLNPSWDFFEPLRIKPPGEYWAIVIDSIAQIGVLLLLFEVGLESTVAEMRKVGVSSLLVAVVGVVAPFALGYGVSALLIKEVPAPVLAMSPAFSINNIHLFIGATLCATSVGITARVFQDLGKMHLREAKIILGAAVIDDVLGLLVLAVVANIVVAAETGTSVDLLSLLTIGGIAIGFLIGALLVGQWVVPRMLHALAKLRAGGLMLTSSLILCFGLSYLANLSGLASIVGAFAAGLILEEVHFKEFREKRTLHELIVPVAALFVPVFFVVMGIQVRLETFLRVDILGLVAGLTVAAFIGKQVCGLAIVEKGLDRLSIGLGMVPRGEVGLIFASIGKSLKIVDDALFSAIVIMVILTTLVTPVLLRFSLQRSERRPNTEVGGT